MMKHQIAFLCPFRVGLLMGLLAAAGTARGEDGYYAGQCADGRTIYFSLAGTGAAASVNLHLEGAWSEALLFQTNSPQGQEFGGGEGLAGEVRWPVVGLRLAPTNRPSAAAGWLFLNADTNGLPFTARRIAVPAGYSRKRGLHLWGRGGGKEFHATWPDFRDDTAFHPAISKLLDAEARGELGRFTAGSHDIMWEGLKTGGASFDWEGTLDTYIVSLGTNLVSLYGLSYEYTGGAHGNSQAHGRNFILDGGKAREFFLKDLFLPGTNWVAAISAACRRELRRQGASWVMPDADPAFQVQEFTAEALASFNVDRSCLFLHFDPYAVGPYVQGRFHVALPWRELEAWLDPKGPTAPLRGSRAAP